MEFRVDEYKLPEVIHFNYEELKAELTEKVSTYETMVYTEDQIKEAKVDRANLNKLKKAINDERIRLEKEYMIPFNEFKSQIKEIIEIIDKPITLIGKQIDEADEKKKAEKLEQINALWDTFDVPNGMMLATFFDRKWLNSTYSLKSIEEEMQREIDHFNSEITVINSMGDFSAESVEYYKKGHSLAEALEFQKSLKDARKEQKTEKVDVMVDDAPIERTWISFRAELSTREARMLKAFFEENNIKFEAI